LAFSSDIGVQGQM